MSRYSEVLESIFTSENKYTVLQLLKALIDAVAEMAGKTVTDVSISEGATVTGEPKTVTLTFTFDDDTTKQLSFTVPAGARGYGITDVRIDNSNHLLVTFADGTTQDAGYIEGAQLYRHLIKVETDYNNNHRFITFEVIDDNANAYNIATFFNRYWGEELSTAEFQSTGTIAVEGSNVGLMRCCITAISGHYRIKGLSSDNNTYDAYITNQNISDTVEPISVVAVKGETGEQGYQGKYTEITAINTQGEATEEGQNYSMVFTERDPADPTYGRTYSKEFLAPRGPQGLKGDKGDKGDPGTGGTKLYLHHLEGFSIYQGCGLNIIDYNMESITTSTFERRVSHRLSAYLSGGGLGTSAKHVYRISYYRDSSGSGYKVVLDDNTETTVASSSLDITQDIITPL